MTSKNSQAEFPCLYTLLSYSDEKLAAVDPLVMNLVVAKGIPQLSHLEIGKYQHKIDRWAKTCGEWIHQMEELNFNRTPRQWENNRILFRLGMVCQWLDQTELIRYRIEKRSAKQILYTNPADLFLNGVMDTREGTCGNMSLLHVVIGWRLNWPVSLACVDSHFICRYDDGESICNMEASATGTGGFGCPPDEEYIQRFNLHPKALSTGSDLRALKPREMLGVFVGCRARHYRDLAFHAKNEGKEAETWDLLAMAEQDYLLARHLFPDNWYLYMQAMGASSVRGEQLFDKTDAGHPAKFGSWLIHKYGEVRPVYDQPVPDHMKPVM